ncbi:MAG TPA: hypothetical protein VEZ71_06910 [Archangium sp.]|nr:hypothetical protein [Archangium sp.]
MLAETLEVPVNVKVHEERFAPLDEHAPDQMAVRLLSTLKVIGVPRTNVADPGMFAWA